MGFAEKSRQLWLMAFRHHEMQQKGRKSQKVSGFSQKPTLEEETGAESPQNDLKQGFSRRKWLMNRPEPQHTQKWPQKAQICASNGFPGFSPAFPRLFPGFSPALGQFWPEKGVLAEKPVFSAKKPIFSRKLREKPDFSVFEVFSADLACKSCFLAFSQSLVDMLGLANPNYGSLFLAKIS